VRVTRARARARSASPVQRAGKQRRRLAQVREGVPAVSQALPRRLLANTRPCEPVTVYGTGGSKHACAPVAGMRVEVLRREEGLLAGTITAVAEDVVDVLWDVEAARAARQGREALPEPVQARWEVRSFNTALGSCLLVRVLTRCF